VPLSALGVAKAVGSIPAVVVTAPPPPGDDVGRARVVGANDKLGFDTTAPTSLEPVGTAATK
jgi:hypothetical protein